MLSVSQCHSVRTTASCRSSVLETARRYVQNFQNFQEFSSSWKMLIVLQDISGEAGDVLYVCYLQMARAGIAALQFWDPNARIWGKSIRVDVLWNDVH